MAKQREEIDWLHHSLRPTYSESEKQKREETNTLGTRKIHRLFTHSLSAKCPSLGKVLLDTE